MEGPQLRITVAQRGVGAWISGWEGGGARPISGAVNAHVTRAGHLGVSQWRVSDVLSGAGPAPTGGGAAIDAPPRIVHDRRMTAA